MASEIVHVKTAGGEIEVGKHGVEKIRVRVDTEVNAPLLPNRCHRVFCGFDINGKCISELSDCQGALVEYRAV